MAKVDDRKPIVAPATLSLAEACRRLGVSVPTALKIEDFPPIISLGAKRVVGRQRFERWLEEKLGLTPDNRNAAAEAVVG
jgi:hypothetical protein